MFVCSSWNSQLQPCNLVIRIVQARGRNLKATTDQMADSIISGDALVGGGDALVAAEQGLPALLDQLIKFWVEVRAPIVAPLLQFAINICLVLVTMLFVERMFMCGVLVFVKLLRRTPETTYRWEPIKDDVEYGNAAYPMVLVQIPMYNEKEVP